jgi:hypothetical protein
VTVKKYELTIVPYWFFDDVFCIMVIAGPEKALVMNAKAVKQPMDSQKLLC